MGLSIGVHLLLFVVASLSFVQKPESGMGTGKGLSVDLIAPSMPAPKAQPVSVPQKVRTKAPGPTPPQMAKPIVKPESGIPQTAEKPLPQPATATLNITMGSTYRVQATAEPLPTAAEPKTGPITSAPPSAAPSAPASTEPNDRTQEDGSPGLSVASRPDYLDNPTPDYPMLARRRGQEGTVIVRVDVDEKGKPTQVTLQKSSGFPLLDNAAVQAVKRWKFKPAKAAFFAVAATVDVPITFKLSK